VRLPGVAKPGSVVDEQVSLVDIMPTILAVTGVAPPAGTRHLAAAVGAGQAVGPVGHLREFFDKRGFNLQVARRTPAEKVIQHFNASRIRARGRRAL